jgi:OOP family OmpA-OmpF porin
VKDYLVKVGVAEHQIITLAKGQSQPRRPNFTESGADNPEGRRVNRRAEIYLDFD